MGAKEEWAKVFKAAVAVAKELRKKNPDLKFPKAMQQAWKDAKIQKMKEDYEKKHKKGGAEKRKRRVSKKKTDVKKKKSRTAKKKSKAIKKRLSKKRTAKKKHAKKRVTKKH